MFQSLQVTLNTMHKWYQLSFSVWGPDSWTPSHMLNSVSMIWICFGIHGEYIGEVHMYIGNLKWIWILNSLYFKIRVNKNSYRFVIIKLQDIFGISKKAFTWKFWPFCFVFIMLKNVKRQTFRLFIYLFTQPFTKLLIF